MTNYCDTNYQSKKAVKDAIKAGAEVRVEAQTPWGTKPVENGTVAVCGPWYPQPHKWYGTATIKDGKITKIT